MAINVGPHALSVDNLMAFDKTRRCRICGGEATWRYQELWHWMLGVYAKIMRRECADCGFEWAERVEIE